MLQTYVEDFNDKYTKGIDLKKKIPELKFAAGMLVASILTPF